LFTGLLIGKQVEVVASKDPTLKGIRGAIMDETKNMLLVVTADERRVNIPKSVVTLAVKDDRSPKVLTIEGSKILGTPAERIKG
jgi:ribonuclease P protein subunit POP4